MVLFLDFVCLSVRTYAMRLLSNVADRSPEIASLASTDVALCEKLSRIVRDPEQVSVASLKLLRNVLESGGDGAELLLLQPGTA